MAFFWRVSSPSEKFLALTHFMRGVHQLRHREDRLHVRFLDRALHDLGGGHGLGRLVGVITDRFAPAVKVLRLREVDDRKTPDRALAGRHGSVGPDGDCAGARRHDDRRAAIAFDDVAGGGDEFALGVELEMAVAGVTRCRSGS